MGIPLTLTHLRLRQLLCHSVTESDSDELVIIGAVNSRGGRRVLARKLPMNRPTNTIPI